MRTPFSLRSPAVLGLCILVATVIATPSQAADHRIECPADMPQESLHVTSVPPGWTPSIRSRMLLHAVDLSFGPPAESAFLKPDLITSKGKKDTDKWINLNEAPSPKGTWIACSYGASDTVILGMRLDEKVSECTATYSKDAQGGPVIDVRCKW